MPFWRRNKKVVKANCSCPPLQLPVHSKLAAAANRWRSPSTRTFSNSKRVCWATSEITTVCWKQRAFWTWKALSDSNSTSLLNSVCDCKVQNDWKWLKRNARRPCLAKNTLGKDCLAVHVVIFVQSSHVNFYSFNMVQQLYSTVPLFWFSCLLPLSCLV